MIRFIRGYYYNNNKSYLITIFIKYGINNKTLIQNKNAY